MPANISLLTEAPSIQALIGGGPTSQRPSNQAQWFIYYDTTLKQQFQWDGSNWNLVGPVSGIPQVGAGVAAARPSSATIGFLYTATDIGVLYCWTGAAWLALNVLSPGSIIMCGIPVAPAGWLNCDGSLQSVSSYPNLAAQIGSIFGGDGITNFGLPDLRGRAPVGYGTGAAPGATAWPISRKAGEETHTLIISEMPSHTHTYDWAPNRIGTAGANPIWANDGANTTNPTGGDQPHNNLQPSIAVNFIIKT